MEKHSCYDLADSEHMLRCVQEQFEHYQELLEQNGRVLAVIGDMEEKSLGEYLFDLNYIRSSLEQVRSSVREIIEKLIVLGGQEYESLRLAYSTIDAQLAQLLPGERPIDKTPYVLWFESLGRGDAFAVGGKNAQLGELRRIGLRVPEGFAITAWAYRCFLDHNDLQTRIREHLESVDVRDYDALVRVSGEVNAMVRSGSVPQDVADAIREGYEELVRRTGSEAVAIRSSGIGEDNLFSFAGQYATFLNVRRESVIDRWLDVVASEFTPQAIYYFLSHGLTEPDVAMPVGCVSMVDAASSGVVYTRDPVHPSDDSLLIHAILGLGESLVDGSLTPDVFAVSRADGSISKASIARKETRLAMSGDGGTALCDVDPVRASRSSISEAVLLQLVTCGLAVERHYGRPQDIEWATDVEGRLFLLQTRALQLVRHRCATDVSFVVSDADVLLSGGTTACPGAGFGPVVQVMTERDLRNVSDGSVVVALNPFPGLVITMGKARALITEVGGVANHIATLAREYRMPTVVGLRGATQLKPGTVVTVDATGGRILRGERPDVLASRRADAVNSFEDTPLFQGYRQILALIAPLHLMDPSAAEFTPQQCRTMHDITRFAHQRAMDEMFRRATRLDSAAQLGLQLSSTLPMRVSVLFLDRPISTMGDNGTIGEDDHDSLPMQAFWNGMKRQGWPSKGRTSSPLHSGLATQGHGRPVDGYSVKSYAVLSTTYMMLCLRMGYHFTTIESMCAEQPGKNYIRVQYKDGGASLERRIRRIRLIAEVLTRLRFDCTARADCLNAFCSCFEAPIIAETLGLLGRLVMMTKQLDMALSSDSVTDWYIEDFLRQLGLNRRATS
ncbi:MAG: hypothetical protein EPN22_17570 [Nitrospirae bacterium]|nr:MAG: hypothetical protein EPN22_17570 [Nitrospirota bacterium]